MSQSDFLADGECRALKALKARIRDEVLAELKPTEPTGLVARMLMHWKARREIARRVAAERQRHAPPGGLYWIARG